MTFSSLRSPLLRQTSRRRLQTANTTTRLLLHPLGQSDDVPFRVGEERDRHLRQLGDRQDRLAAELLGLVEQRLRVVGADVERHVARALRRLPMPPPIPPSSPLTIAYGISPGSFSVC